ncbi:uncharacterized protein LOC111101966 [Crassostrea virginica]
MAVTIGQTIVGILAAVTVRIQGQTAPPSACSVTYQDQGPGTQLDPSEFYLTYSYSPIVTSLADCTQLCDDDSQCKAFGFSQDVNGVLCGLSEVDNVLSSGTCTPCHVYVKNCSADCVTYTEFGGGYMGVRQYANHDPSPYNACRDRCTNDPYCNGFIHSHLTLACRLVDTSKAQVYVDDTSFSFYRKECSFGCSTYLEYGAEYILDMGTVYQIIAPTTARECERLCSSNSLCRGHAYRTSHQDCGLFISGTESFWGGCLACSAAAKQCPAGNIPIDRGSCTVTTYTVFPKREASAPYTSTPAPARSSCQSLCTADPVCRGFFYDDDTGECVLSESVVPRYSTCTNCSYSAKDCADTSTDYFTQCSPTFTKQGTNMTVQFESANQDGSDLVTCQSLCQADADCLSFHYDPTGGQCRLSSSDLSSASGACADCQFFTKDCLPGCSSWTYIAYGFGYIVSSIRRDLVGHVTSLLECRGMCDNDTLCLGFTYKAETSRCVLSGSGGRVWYPECPSCSFWKKTCVPQEITTPVAIEEVVVINGTMECICVCRDTNRTLEEIVEQRKNELMVDTETLSSTYRKLSSAPDNRSSSKAIGAIGASVLGVFVALIVLPDLCVVISYLIKKFSCKESS